MNSFRRASESFTRAMQISGIEPEDEAFFEGMAYMANGFEDLLLVIDEIKDSKN
ncbi:MAG: hypothetical protein KKF65_02435 [Nanoarchaeota archaeon]|nr:hypothetical protein [Nanoarchaeota archaeon]